MSDRVLAVINPAAGGGRCGRLAGAALARLPRAGISAEAVRSGRPGQATSIVREAYARGCRNFIAVGGDGTAFEVVNGLFPESLRGGRATLGFLPLGTGNSFLRDFVPTAAPEAAGLIASGKRRSCDVIRLIHSAGELYYINLLTLGFAADVAAVTNRRFKRLGQLGYICGVLVCLLRLRRRAFPLSVNGAGPVDRRPCLFLSFNNSKFTGGKMKIAPHADPGDGLIEIVRWGPIGRLGLLRNLHTLFDGSHIHHPLASRLSATSVEFEPGAHAEVMIDGESLKLECRRLEILPGALEIMA